MTVIEILSQINEMIEEGLASIEYAKSIKVKCYDYDIGYIDALKELKIWIEQDD